jgi:glycosyltransferase involved in cell wall biosynthesis
MRIFILHPGKANYPELNAYAKYFSERGCQVTSGTLDQYRYVEDPRGCVLWCIMGLYPTRLPARYVIHDYRSLSVGSQVVLKDKLKKMLNPRPDLRIFQNESMRVLMGFRDDVETVLLPMGVPDWIFTVDAYCKESLPSGTYCYLGEITRERGIDAFLSDFVSARRGSETLVLVGAVEKAIVDAYHQASSIVFTGRLSQRDALTVVRNCEFAISMIPYRRPYNVQTPTKLLEYAALGKRIICNDSPSNLDAAAAFGIRCKVTGPNVFAGIGYLTDNSVPFNDPATMEHLRWNNVIAASGIERCLKRVAALGMR